MKEPLGAGPVALWVRWGCGLPQGDPPLPPPPAPCPPAPAPGHPPSLLLFQDHLPGLQVEAPVVTGALGQRHTVALLVQEGVVGAAAAVHGRKALEAVTVSLGERAAGLLAGGQVVQEHL